MADPGMITKIVFNLIAIVLITKSVLTAPADLNKENTKNCSESDQPYEIIDQRQNGTENYRINIKDVVFIWAPADSLLAATALLDAQILGADLNSEDDAAENKPGSGLQNQEKPEIVIEIVENKPAEQNNSSMVNVSSSTQVPEKLTSSTEVASTTDKSEDLKRSKYRYAGNIGPFIRRRLQKQ